jgi:hypothetical protein
MNLKNIGLLAGTLALIVYAGKSLDYQCFADINFRLRQAYAQVECAVDEAKRKIIKISREESLIVSVPPLERLLETSLSGEVESAGQVSKAVRETGELYRANESEVNYFFGE